MKRLIAPQPYPRLQRKAFWAKKLSILKAKKRPKEALFVFLECCFLAPNLVVKSWKKVKKLPSNNHTSPSETTSKSG